MPFTTRLLSTTAPLVAAILLLAGASIGGPSVAAAQDDDTQQAVMDVVQGFNDAMVDATAQRDTNLIRDYITDAFYQEMALEMRADWSAGLAAVNLVELEWGTITISGNEATVYTVETWAMTGIDGSGGELPPEINLYRLVLQSDGWKVDANEHPNSLF